MGIRTLLALAAVPILAAPAYAQVPPVGEAVPVKAICGCDLSPHPPGFDCVTYCCSRNWRSLPICKAFKGPAIGPAARLPGGSSGGTGMQILNGVVEALPGILSAITADKAQKEARQREALARQEAEAAARLRQFESDKGELLGQTGALEGSDLGLKEIGTADLQWKSLGAAAARESEFKPMDVPLAGNSVRRTGNPTYGEATPPPANDGTATSTESSPTGDWLCGTVDHPLDSWVCPRCGASIPCNGVAVIRHSNYECPNRPGASVAAPSATRGPDGGIEPATAVPSESRYFYDLQMRDSGPTSRPDAQPTSKPGRLAEAQPPLTVPAPTAGDLRRIPERESTWAKPSLADEATHRNWATVFFRQKLAEVADERYERDYGLVNDSALEGRVRRLVDCIRAVSPYPAEDFTIRIVDLPRAPSQEKGVEDNAAAGGDAIYVGRALLAEVDDAALRFILAHELGHIYLDHNLKSFGVALFESGLAAAQAGGTLDESQLAEKRKAWIREQVLKTRMHDFKQAEELDADRLGAGMTLACGGKPGDVLSAFGWIRAKESAQLAELQAMLESKHLELTAPDRRLVEMTRDHSPVEDRLKALNRWYDGLFGRLGG